MEKELIILAIYINVGGLSRQQAEQCIFDLIKAYEDLYKDINKNVKVYWFPVDGNQQTRVECVYPPAPINNGNIENELLKIYKLLLNGSKDDANDIIRDIERKIKISKIKTRLN